MNASSPASAPLGRMLWKEYRTQRALWSVLFFVGLVAQVTFRIVLSNPADGISAESRAGAVWSLVILMPFLFVTGSTAILFAGEREDRTCHWLVHLAAPPGWLLLAKWGFVVISSLALALALSTTALALVWMLPPSANNERNINVTAGVVVFASFVVWGSLGSLLSRRVVTAIPATFFWWMAIALFPVVGLNLLFGFRFVSLLQERIQFVLVALAYVIVVIADVWLGWQWCRGKYWDVQILDNLKQRVTGYLRSLRRQPQQTSRIPAEIEVCGTWRREWQRLIWQERHRESLHRIYLYGGCALAVLLPVLSIGRFYSLTSCIVPVIVFAPFAMGLLGFRYDGEGQPLRFLASRGVSSRSVWLAKHAVWFPRAIWIPFVVWIAGFCAEMMTWPVDLNTHAVIVSRDYWLTAVYFRASQMPFDFFIHSGPVSWIFWLVVLGYGCGQLAAMTSQKVILAIVTGVALNVLMSIWLVAMVVLAVPLWWSVGGMAAWLFALTWWSAPHWLTERRLFKRPSRMLASLLLPPMLLVGAVGAWRANEIVGFVPAWSPLMAVLHPQEFTRRDGPLFNNEQTSLSSLPILQSEIARQSQPPLPAIRQASDQLAQAIGPFSDARLKSILEVARQNLDSSPFFPWLELNDPPMLPHNDCLFEAGRRHTEAGRLEDALECYCASLRLASFWAKGQGISYRETADHLQEQTLQRIIVWANHRDQTAISLRQAIPRIREELQRFPSWRETLVAQYREDLVLLKEIINSGTDGTDRKLHYAQRWPAEIVNIARFLPWERFRAFRLLERQLLSNDRMLSNLANGLNQPGVDVLRRQEQAMVLLDGRDLSRIDDLRNLITTPLAFGVSSRFDQGFEFSIIERETVIRQSLLALELLAWKLEHHSWPDALHQLITRGRPESLPAITTTDPWCGEFFEYNGIFANKNASESFSPLLTTLGPGHQREVLIDGPGGGVTTTEHGLYIGYRTWGGQQTKDGYERCRLQIEEGRLVLYIPPR